MNATRTTLVGVILAVATTMAQAQFVKGNEAVKLLPDGTRAVKTPPMPAIRLASPCKAENPSCTAGGWLMVETRHGLQECTEYYARPGTCRASTHGAEKHHRLWIVKLKGEWMQCRRPDLTSVCVSTKALPYSEVQ